MRYHGFKKIFSVCAKKGVKWPRFIGGNENMDKNKWGGLRHQTWLVVADGEGKGEKLVLFRTGDPDEATDAYMRARRLGYKRPRILRKAVDSVAARGE